MTPKKVIHHFCICTVVSCSIFLQGCLLQRPRVRPENVTQIDTIRGYIQVNKPYYRKKPNVLGHLFTIAAMGGGGYFGYNYNPDNITTTSTATNDNQALYAAGGAVGGYLASKLLMLIIGNHKKVYLKDTASVSKWVFNYNKYQEKDWILVNRPPYYIDSLWVLPKAKELSFLPLNLNDVKNYTDAYGDNDYTNTVIDAATPKISRAELLEMVQLYPTKLSIINTKVEYVNRSVDEKDILKSIQFYPETQPRVEAKYAELVSTFPYSKDFIAKYPKTQFSDKVFGKIYPKVPHDTLEQLIDLYPTVSTNLSVKAKTIFYNDIDSLDLLLTKLNKYQDTFYFVKPTDNYETFDNADILRNNIKSNQAIAATKTQKLLDQLRYNYFTQALTDTKGTKEESRDLFKRASKSDWLKKSDNDPLYEQAIIEYCKNNGDDYFTGKRNSKGQPVNEGILYTPKGEIIRGNFIKGKLNGKGSIAINDKIYEGTFENNELNGEGSIKDSIKIISGSFVSGNLTGKGKIAFFSGRTEIGEFYLFRLNGKGERTYINGNNYAGSFEKGEFNGLGKYTWKADNIYFEGNFKEGNREGAGVLYIANNLVAIGNWKNDCATDTIIVKESVSSTEILATYIIKDCKIDSKQINADKANLIDDKILIKLPEAIFY